ncbi:unnamed protein product, partial [Amoebophrya sp. A25]|eukprot:GSA25T00024875001.1
MMNKMRSTSFLRFLLCLLPNDGLFWLFGSSSCEAAPLLPWPTFNTGPSTSAETQGLLLKRPPQEHLGHRLSVRNNQLAAGVEGRGSAEQKQERYVLNEFGQPIAVIALAPAITKPGTASSSSRTPTNPPNVDRQVVDDPNMMIASASARSTSTSAFSSTSSRSSPLLSKHVVTIPRHCKIMCAVGALVSTSAIAAVGQH